MNPDIYAPMPLSLCDSFASSRTGSGPVGPVDTFVCQSALQIHVDACSCGLRPNLLLHRFITYRIPFCEYLVSRTLSANNSVAVGTPAPQRQTRLFDQLRIFSISIVLFLSSPLQSGLDLIRLSLQYRVGLDRVRKRLRISSTHSVGTM